MDTRLASRKLYRPIKAYQTRIIQLHGDNGDSDSSLVCTLHHADILHPKFDGLGLRAPRENEDCIVEYDALSYTWGNEERANTIICNGVDFPITENLHGALHALRRSQENSRFFWVDAISINQNDDNEKAEQVWNMLSIYQKATRVIAWLGDIQPDDMKNVAAASSISLDGSHEDSFDFWSICAGITYLYTRPWFQRMWIQQEVFGARELLLQCGSLRFKWSKALSDPKSLATLPNLRSHSQSNMDENTRRKGPKATIPDDIAAHFNAISALDQLHTRRLHCFEQFSGQDRCQPDFLEALLDTGNLSATDKKDYVYGIIGMTVFPAKAMSIQDWTTARQHEVFIPIDYDDSVHLNDILAAITWVALMKCGLTILAKFKAFAAGDDDDTSMESLPSWVIDWRLAATAFSSRKESRYGELLTEDTVPKMENAWDLREHLKPGRDSSLRRLRTLVPFPPHHSHAQFCIDNKKSTVPHTKLVVRGIIDPRFHAEGRCLWNEKPLLKDNAMWDLGFEVHGSDLVVYLSDFVYGRRRISAYRPLERESGGLWLLRPAGNDEFKLMACLPWKKIDECLLYENWEWKSGNLVEISLQEQPVTLLRRLARDPAHSLSSVGMPIYSNADLEPLMQPHEKIRVTDLRTFTIV